MVERSEEGHGSGNVTISQPDEVNGSTETFKDGLAQWSEKGIPSVFVGVGEAQRRITLIL